MTKHALVIADAESEAVMARLSENYARAQAQICVLQKDAETRNQRLKRMADAVMQMETAHLLTISDAKDRLMILADMARDHCSGSREWLADAIETIALHLGAPPDPMD